MNMENILRLVSHLCRNFGGSLSVTILAVKYLPNQIDHLSSLPRIEYSCTQLKRKATLELNRDELLQDALGKKRAKASNDVSQEHMP